MRTQKTDQAQVKGQTDPFAGFASNETITIHTQTCKEAYDVQ